MEDEGVNPAAGTEENRDFDRDQRFWAMLCHISGLAGLAIPLGNIIVPMVIWALKRYDYPLVDDQGREAINFQISITIYFFISAFLILLVIGIPLLIILAAADIILVIIAGLKALEGTKYRYPLNVRLIK